MAFISLFSHNRHSSDIDSDPEWEATSTPVQPLHREEQQSSTPSRGETQTPVFQNGFSRTSRGRGCRRKSSSSSSQVVRSASISEERWNDVNVSDITPPQPTFRPARSPGPQLVRTASYTALQLFQLFFTNSILQTIIQNTNEYGLRRFSTPSNPWIDLTLEDMFSYMSLVVYMGVVKCNKFTDYWRGGKLYNLLFPRRVMTGKKFFMITRSLHLSSFEVDAVNEEKKGTEAFDCLSKIKPLYDEMRDACRRNFHPGQEISINDQMLAPKAHIGPKQYMKNMPTRWGYKLFVLADSRNGYTWDFFIYEGRTQGNSGKGLGYDTVMKLVNTQLLGTGYKLFVDHFYTSPALFRDLLEKKIWACGTVRLNRIGYHSMDPKAPRGSIRWMRKDSLLYVQWRDTRDVLMCSTLHTAHAKDTVKRRVKGEDGQWTLTDVPVPPSVKDYNRYVLHIHHLCFMPF